MLVINMLPADLVVHLYSLNITAAKRVFIVELQWNPSVENQAIARTTRLGQEEKVVVVRYMIKGTVEEVYR